MEWGLLQSFMAAFMGTALMTISSETEAALTGRGASDTPGRVVSVVIEALGGSPLEGASLKVASTWMHWVYGTAWGVVFWLLVERGTAGLAVAAAMYFAIVWTAAQVLLPLLRVSKPTWSYGAKALATDVWHHVVYASGTALCWWLIELASAGGHVD